MCLDVSKEGIYFGQMGIGGVASGDPAFLSKPSDLAPEVIGFGLIPAGDPNGPLIRAQDDLDQRPTPERCIEAKPFHLQRTRFEVIAERKLRRRQLTDDGNVEITGRDPREKTSPVGQGNLFEAGGARVL
jgi:hypothetical protein